MKDINPSFNVAKYKYKIFSYIFNLIQELFVTHY